MKQRGAATIFLIFTGLVLGFFMIGFMKNGPVFIEPVKEQPIYSYPYIGCGIEINSPKVMSTIGNVFEISGKISGCGWDPVSGFFAELNITSGGELVAENIKIPVNNDGTFKSTIALKKTPKSENVILELKSISGYGIATFSVYFK